MSEKINWPCKKGMLKVIKIKGQRYTILLGYTWDLTNGKGWFCRALKMRWFKPCHWFSYDVYYDDGFAVHKNKFTAVKQAIKNIKKN